MNMVDRVTRWEPLIIGICAPVIVALLLGVVGLLWTNTTSIALNTDKIASIAEVQPRMTKKLNTIISQMGGFQTKADAFRQHDRMRKRINNLDKRVTVLESATSRSNP